MTSLNLGKRRNLTIKVRERERERERERNVIKASLENTSNV